MQKTLRIIDAFTGFIGKSVAWLTYAMVLLTVVIVAIRQFNLGSIAMQETVMYIHATVFMLGIAYTLRQDEHVRVDVFYTRFSPKAKAIVNIAGTLLFLLPFSATVIWLSWGYVSRSWHMMEHSLQSGGLPYVYLLKTLIIVFAVLLIVQGIGELLRNILILRGKVIQEGELS